MTRIAPLSLALLALSCTPSEDAHTPADEACEHAAAGPFEEVSATTAAETPPDISMEHTAYKVRTAELLDEGGNRGGRVAYASGAEGLVSIFLSEHMDVAVFDSSGAEVALTDSVHEVADCAELSMFHTVELGVGTYELELGPTSLEEVLLVVEPGAMSASHDESDHEG